MLLELAAEYGRLSPGDHVAYSTFKLALQPYIHDHATYDATIAVLIDALVV